MLREKERTYVRHVTDLKLAPNDTGVWHTITVKISGALDSPKCLYFYFCIFCILSEQLTRWRCLCLNSILPMTYGR